MKTKISALVLGIVAASVTTFALPTHYEIFASATTLVHDSAYKWKIDLNRLADAKGEIISAKLEFIGIDNIYTVDGRGYDDPNDVLYTNLIDLSGHSVTGPGAVDANAFVAREDKSGGGNFWGTTYTDPMNDLGYTNTTSIGTWSDLVDNNIDNNNDGIADNLSYNLDVSKLNSYKADNGWLGFGFDSDCTYIMKDKFNNLKLTLDYKTTTVPEPSSIGLLLIGLTMLGGAAFSRKKRS
jgi:hypothetical protein